MAHVLYLFSTLLVFLGVKLSSGSVASQSVPNGCIVQESAVNKEHELATRDAHNFYRSKHNAPALILNDQLSIYAQKCAEFYANKGTVDSSCTFKNGAGENQYATYYVQTVPSCSSLGNSATTFWYNAGQDYDYRTPGYSTTTGAFTQLVWRSSRQLGVGCAVKSGFAVVVSLYSPPGNLLAHGNDPNILFRQNVYPRQQTSNRNSRAIQRSTFQFQ